MSMMSMMTTVCMSILAFMIKSLIQCTVWAAKNPCWWLIRHPFQLSSGILGVTIAFLIVKTQPMTMISGFVLGGSIAHLIHLILHKHEQRISLLLYPIIGGLAGGCLFFSRVDPSLYLVSALALACVCYQQASLSRN